MYKPFFALRSCYLATTHATTFSPRLILSPAQMATLSTNDQKKAVSLAMCALIDGDSEVTADQIAVILKACNVTVEPYWPSLYAGIKSKAKDIVLEGGGL